MLELGARVAGGPVFDSDAARLAAVAAAAAATASPQHFPADAAFNAKFWSGPGGAISDELLQAVQLQLCQQSLPHAHSHQAAPSNSNAPHSMSCVQHSPAGSHMGSAFTSNTAAAEFGSALLSSLAANQSPSLPLPYMNPFSVTSQNNGAAMPFGPCGPGPFGPLPPTLPQLEQLRLFQEQLMGSPAPGAGYPSFEQLAALQAAAAAGAFSPLGPLDPRAALCCGGSGLMGAALSGGSGGLGGGAPFGYCVAGGSLAHLGAKRKRIRTAFSPAQLLRLESIFEKTPYVIGQERKELAMQLSLSETQVCLLHMPTHTVLILQPAGTLHYCRVE